MQDSLAYIFNHITFVYYIEVHVFSDTQSHCGTCLEGVADIGEKADLLCISEKTGQLARTAMVKGTNKTLQFVFVSKEGKVSGFMDLITNDAITITSEHTSLINWFTCRSTKAKIWEELQKVAPVISDTTDAPKAGEMTKVEVDELTNTDILKGYREWSETRWFCVEKEEGPLVYFGFIVYFIVVAVLLYFTIKVFRRKPAKHHPIHKDGHDHGAHHSHGKHGSVWSSISTKFM